MRIELTILALVAASGSNAAPAFSPEQVLDLVARRGARAAVHDIWSSRAHAQQFLSGVGSGDEGWLRAAKAVSPGTDAGASEELADALSLALLAKPYHLLPWLHQQWWGGGTAVCVFSQDSELPGGVDGYVTRLEIALSVEPPPGLAELRSQCLKGLERTRAIRRAPF